MPPLKGQLRQSYTEIPGLALYTAASRAHNKGTVIIRTGFRGPLYYPSTPGPAKGTLFSDPVQYTSACKHYAAASRKPNRSKVSSLHFRAGPL